MCSGAQQLWPWFQKTPAGTKLEESRATTQRLRLQRPTTTKGNSSKTRVENWVQQLASSTEATRRQHSARAGWPDGNIATQSELEASSFSNCRVNNLCLCCSTAPQGKISHLGASNSSWRKAKFETVGYRVKNHHIPGTYYIHIVKLTLHIMWW